VKTYALGLADIISANKHNETVTEHSVLAVYQIHNIKIVRQACGPAPLWADRVACKVYTRTGGILH